MSALLTDLYQLTMAAGYWAEGKTHELATFELFTRKLPPHRDFLVAAGLAQAVDYLLNLRFTGDEIQFLRRLPQLQRAPDSFFEYLREFRFTGDVWAMPEGTPLLPNEPILTLRAPVIEAQIPETYLLAQIGFQTMIASKCVHVLQAAGELPVVEMGTRRAHGPEAGVLAARACYLAGAAGTSNVLAGQLYGVPVYGTAAHSWVMSFSRESQSFAALQKLLGPGTIYLIDTYDTLRAARTVSELGEPLWGVRIDSGDLAVLSRKVRQILDEAGLHRAKIMVTGDLHEDKIRALIESGAPIDSLGVGTDLATSADAPNIGVIYKMVEMDGRYTAKNSEAKATLPGHKQVFRQADRDVLALAKEEFPGEPLLQPVLANGKLAKPLPGLEEIRAQVKRRLPPPSRVVVSHALLEIQSELQSEL